MSIHVEQNNKQALVAQEYIGQYLTFLIENETFAINILEIKEIIELTNVTHIPLTPNFIYGVINLRGNVVPVIDLCARLKRHPSETSKLSCIILISIQGISGPQLIGILVDEVHEILEISSRNIQPPPDFGVDIHTEFIQAMACVEDKFIILLAIDRVLSLEELSQLNKMEHLAELHLETAENS